jgi:hypothetical protein
MMVCGGGALWCLLNDCVIKIYGLTKRSVVLWCGVVCCEGVRPYFRVMMTLVLLKDSLHTTRANALIESLVTVIHTQSRFWKITDFCFEHLLRMARKSRTVYTWLNAHQKYCENLIGWLHAYAEPPAPSFHRGLGGAGDDSQVILLKPQSEAPRVPARTGAEHLAALDLQMRAGQRGRGALYGGPDVGMYCARFSVLSVIFVCMCGADRGSCNVM